MHLNYYLLSQVIWVSIRRVCFFSSFILLLVSVLNSLILLLKVFWVNLIVLHWHLMLIVVKALYCIYKCWLQKTEKPKQELVLLKGQVHTCYDNDKEYKVEKTAYLSELVKNITLARNHMYCHSTDKRKICTSDTNHQVALSWADRFKAGNQYERRQTLHQLLQHILSRMSWHSTFI